jgi:transaldolase
VWRTVKEEYLMTNTLKQLLAAGTSPWLDNIRRGWLQSGEFRRMVDEGVVGVTSNPTIFQKAIADSTDYDSAVAALQASGVTPTDAFFELSIADVREAADQIRPVYDGSGHLDGFVSFELPPGMANDTAASVAAAPDFFNRIGRPNIFIKIPGTAEGVPAIEETIAAGINVNVTLLFSLAKYEDIHEAYIRGLERRVAAGEPIADLHSVASFFVSRVDTAVDAQLPEGSPLRGRAAVANAKLAYQRFGEIVASDRWRALAEKGATVQRPLWASTGTKNAAYSDVLYVDELIGPDCVNTMPEGTIAAFLDHGTVRRTVDADVDGARRLLEQVEAAGVSIDAVTKQLEIDGVKAFSASFDSLIATLAGSMEELRARGAA